ncbi:MAG: hypothetical protein P4L77_10865 [Sulfuriferula sp.]|nr:hypothetical protein [Sulfuriferula sp.]
MRLRRLVLAMETIQFQSDGFAKELALVYSEIRKEFKGSSKSKLSDSEYGAHLGKIIKNRSGLTVSVDLTNYGPAVNVPSLNKNNPLVNESIREMVPSTEGIRLIQEAGGAVKGKVNMKTAMVSGVFAEMRNTLYMPVSLVLDAKYTVDELAAVTLHEIGHLFTYCEYMARTVTTNQVLAGMAKGLANAKTPEEREIILVSTKKALKLDIDATELAKEKDNTVIEYVVVTNVGRQAESELGTNIYDFNTWEMLSDQFAARHGAGVHLVTALEKLYKSYGNISFRSTSGYLAMEALKATLFFGSIAAAFVGGFTAIAGRFGISFAMALIMMDGMGDGTYDRPGVRLRRVRNQIVEEMKDKKISPDHGARLTEDLLAIDEVLKTVNDREQLAGLLWNVFSRDSRKRMSQEKLTSELEAIATNDLFVQSLKFRQLAVAQA